MTRNSEVSEFGLWKSSLSAEVIFSAPARPNYPHLQDGTLYWVEQSADSGHSQLIRLTPDGVRECLTPEVFSLRSRVHEYGGRALLFLESEVIFSNDQDQRLYRQHLTPGALPRPITPKGGDQKQVGRFADLVAVKEGGFLLAVGEQEDQDGGVINNIVSLPLNQQAPSAPTTLFGESDFVANLVVSPDGERLAWIAWNHPSMPWDQSRLMTAEIISHDHGIALDQVTTVVEGEGVSVCQLEYALDGELFFIKDSASNEDSAAGYWNIHSWDGRRVRAVTQETFDYGEPLWVFGDKRLLAIDSERLLAVRSERAGDVLVTVDRTTGESRIVDQRAAGYTQLAGVNQREASNGAPTAVMITSSAERGAEISVWSSEHAELEPLVASTLLLEKEDLSVAQPMVYQTRDGVQAHAYFYPPRNSSFEATIDSLPPLMVLIHGGPTARVLPLFEPRIQYWTTRGYAVVDVNYRGSSGYGRRYRDALYGRWGERDINDVVDAIHFLVVRELIDPERIVLRGSSAGGYAVLQLLVHYPGLFRAGASYYGIGNLATLASITHKFEKYYTDRLIGEDYDLATANKSSSLYYQRSPIFYLDQLNAPLVLFQGLDDKVVPPSLSKEVVKALEDRGISCQYVEYPDEGHGFRGKKARVDALERETRFFSEILFSA